MTKFNLKELKCMESSIKMQTQLQNMLYSDNPIM